MLTYRKQVLTYEQIYTMLRGLMMDFVNDSKACTIADQYMFGPTIMVCPVTSPNATSREVYLPKCSGWYDFYTGKFYSSEQTISSNAPIDKIPMLIKAVSIVTLGETMQYTDEKPDAPITILVYIGEDASFTLYEDEGEGDGYENGHYSEISLEWSENKKTLTISNRKGEFSTMLSSKNFTIAFITKDGYQSEIKQSYDGKAISIPMNDIIS